ncbi:MAG: TolC family protein, partial [Candidatus Omnitrophica bacterium]|nr:TolC family protein [Candidatus Omnitrophota bacterium]
MPKKILICFIAAAFLFAEIFSSSAAVLSLDDLIKEAKEKNPEILAAKNRWDAALVRVPMAKSLDAPSVGFTFKKIPDTLNVFKAPNDEHMLTISQFLPLFGKLSTKGKIALAESQMFAAEYKNKELEIVNETKDAYYDLFMNYKEIELNEASLSLLKSVAGISEAKYITGKTTQEDLFKINLEIASLGNKIANLKLEQAAKNARLNSLLSRDPESPLGAPELREDAVFNRDISSLYKLTLENQPELLTFSYVIERNKHAKTLAEKNSWPDLMAGVALRGIGTGSFGLWDLMLAFTVPFWFWTKQKYEVKEAISNLDEAKAAYEAMKNKALLETKNLFTDMEISKSKIDLNKNNLIPMLESSINSSVANFRSGKGDLMALLDC